VRGKTILVSFNRRREKRGEGIAAFVTVTRCGRWVSVFMCSLDNLKMLSAKQFSMRVILVKETRLMQLIFAGHERPDQVCASVVGH
jgi:hypothetical protein